MGKKGKWHGSAEPTEVKAVSQPKGDSMDEARLNELNLLQENLDGNAVPEGSPLRAYVAQRRREIEGEIAGEKPKELTPEEVAREEEVSAFEKYLDSRGIGAGDEAHISRQYVRRRHADLHATGEAVGA